MDSDIPVARMRVYDYYFITTRLKCVRQSWLQQKFLDWLLKFEMFVSSTAEGRRLIKF